MSDPKPQTDVRPYAVRDALDPAALPRVVINVSPAAAVSYVVGARFTAQALNAMELLALTSRGEVQVEDPRGSLVRPAPVVSTDPTEPQASLLPSASISEPAPL